VPLLDAELRADALEVGHEIVDRVLRELAERRAAARAALVDEHDAQRARIEEAPVHRRAARARPAVHEEHRRALGIAALLEVERVARADGQAFGVERFDFRVQARGRHAWKANRACIGRVRSRA
jgi:hypothetical protein